MLSAARSGLSRSRVRRFAPRPLSWRGISASAVLTSSDGLQHDEGGLPVAAEKHGWRRILRDALREGTRSVTRPAGSASGHGGKSSADGQQSAASAAANQADGADRASLRRFLSLLYPERQLVAAAVSTIAVTSPVMLILPRAIGGVLDSALATEPGAAAGMSPGVVVAGLAGLFAVQAGLIGFRSGALAIAGERIATRLRIDAFRSLLRQDVAWFDAQSTGDLVNRLSSDATVVQKALTTQVAAGLRNGAMAVGSTGLLVWLSPSLAAVSLCAIPPLAIMARGFGRYMRGRQERVQRGLGDTLKVAEGLVTGVRTVRAFGAERRELARFETAVGGALEQARRVSVAQAGFDAALHWSTNLALLAVLGYGGFLVESGAMTAGDLTSFLMYSLYAGFNFAGLGSVWAEWQRGVGASRRVFAVLDAQPTMPSVVGPASLARAEAAKADAAAAASLAAGSDGLFSPAATDVEGVVAFDDVSFAYPTRSDAPVLRGFTLALEPGKTTALVGASGSGKSTAASLLLRLYDPQGGSVSLDGRDLREWAAGALRGSAVGLVEQQPRLVASTVRENIAYGRPDASDEEVWAAARDANCADFIAGFPQKLDTPVGEGGQQLSGGQRARVALARVLLAAPPVVVLDEASAALDARSEAAVTEAVRRVTRGRTVLTIAHRLSTMRSADTVAVLEGGRVVEQGPFQALASQPGSKLSALLAGQLIRADGQGKEEEEEGGGAVVASARGDVALPDRA